MAIVRSSGLKPRQRKGTPIPPDEIPSEAQKTIFLKTLAEDLSQYDARHAAKISRDQLAKLLQSDPAFAKAIHEIVLDNPERLEGALLRGAIVKGDKDLIKIALPAVLPEKYGPRANLNLNVDVTKLTDEELDALIEKHSKRS
jgi:hypothetical protein